MIYAEGHALNAETAELYGNKHSVKTPRKCGAYTYQRITCNSFSFNENKQKLN